MLLWRLHYNGTLRYTVGWSYSCTGQSYRCCNAVSVIAVLVQSRTALLSEQDGAIGHVAVVMIGRDEMILRRESH